jgi:4-hydroxy-4-methyl-2-oxoglutarate aldolase
MNDLPPLSAIAECLYTAVLSDVLDEAGFMGQALRPFVRPLDEASVLCGFARTGLYRKVFHTEPGRNPYEIEMDLVDDLKGGEVAVLACDGPTDVVAPWGELLTTAASLRGAAGCRPTASCATCVASARCGSRSSPAASARSTPGAGPRWRRWT